jgi:hypothetical protein
MKGPWTTRRAGLLSAPASPMGVRSRACNSSNRTYQGIMVSRSAGGDATSYSDPRCGAMHGTVGAETRKVCRVGVVEQVGPVVQKMGTSERHGRCLEGCGKYVSNAFNVVLSRQVCFDNPLIPIHLARRGLTSGWSGCRSESTPCRGGHLQHGLSGKPWICTSCVSLNARNSWPPWDTRYPQLRLTFLSHCFGRSGAGAIELAVSSGLAQEGEKSGWAPLTLVRPGQSGPAGCPGQWAGPLPR